METTHKLSYQLPTIIKEISKNFDSRWRLRKRKIDTQFLILFILKLVLSKNKQGYNITLHDMWHTSSYDTSISLPQDKPFAASSVCEARQKMPPEIFKEINSSLLESYEDYGLNKLWKGHRVFGIDGSRLNLPHDLVNDGYIIQHKKQRHYPTGLLSVLYSLSDGLVYDFSLDSYINERVSLLNHLDIMRKNDIAILDRGYFNYLILYQVTQKNLNLICRMQSGGTNKEVKLFFEGDETDKVIEYYPSIPTKHTIKKQGYNLSYKKIKLRLFKYTINNEVYVCSTTLLDKKYSVEDLVKLYHSRWGVEELYKISKQIIDIEDFHSSTETGVKQEVYAHLMLINIARIFNNEIKNDLDNNDSNIDDYWQELFDEVRKIKLNFKSCLFFVGQSLSRIFSFSNEPPSI